MLDRVLQFHKVLGIVFLALLLGAVYLTYALFTKQFTAYDRVELQSSTVGLQLPMRADVKVDGVIVGEVLDREATADGGATITLGIYPDQIDRIPSNVTGAIIPKTLFGEKYVSLEVPTDASSTPLAADDVIAKTQVSTEVEKVLSDLYPLLKAVQPADLNMTLNAISTALEGRGNQLGQTLETTDAYLKRINPKIPALVDDLRKTANVSNTYSDILPQVADILDNTVTTTTTLEDRQTQVRQLFQDVSAFSDTARDFLNTNEENLVEFGELSTRQLRILSRYAPEFPCLTAGIVKAGKSQAAAFRGFTLHITLETIPNQPRAYTRNDRPVYGESRGYSCLHLPSPPWSPNNPVRRVPNFADGVNSSTGKGTDRVAPGFVGGTDTASGSRMWADLLAPVVGVAPAKVDALGGLLLAPMARGSKVTLR